MDLHTAPANLSTSPLSQSTIGPDIRLEEKNQPRLQGIQRYAEMIVTQAMNVQPDQEVTIECEIEHRALALSIATAAYKLGAKFVDIKYLDDALTKIRADETLKVENLSFSRPLDKARWDYIVDSNSARVMIHGKADPRILSGCDPKRISAITSKFADDRRRYFEEGVNQQKVQWSVVAAPTKNWAKEVFPNLTPELAYDTLWDAILSACRVDTVDWKERWVEQNRKLKERCEKLNAEQFEGLRFVGPGTDLYVGLLEQSIFKGGSKTTVSGNRFNANIPTEEVFTSPDWRKTSGEVRTTRPVLLNGTLIEGLGLRFENGEVVGFSADKGYEVFEQFLKTDAGAKRLGEIALVGSDSPIFQSGLLFFTVLFDENAASHLALGSAYTHCIRGSADMSKEELATLGVNSSKVHSDFMISSPEVSVFGVRKNGEEVPLLTNGVWNIN